MKIKKIFAAVLAVICIISLVACIYCVCYETLDIFGPERAKSVLDLTPYAILVSALISFVSGITAIVLFKKSK